MGRFHLSVEKIMVVNLGTLGSDVEVGSAVADQLSGQASSDTLYGGTGNDVLSGGEGRDTLYGGAGDDALYGFGSSDAIDGSGDLRATRIATGYDTPVFAISAPGRPNQLFVVEKGGQIEIVDVLTGVKQATPFLTIPPAGLTTTGESGLLGLAFDPDYATNGRFFVYVTNASGDLEIRKYDRSASNANLADASSGDVILTIPHPTNTNHNGGWLGFGPDGYLYIATGDGGGGGDPANNAQNINSLLGKMLRIDVSSDAFPTDAGRDYAIPTGNPFSGVAGADEIWAIGLRNPWRPSFDRVTGDLYIADVGQDALEEVNFQAAGSAGGANYGWAIREGTQPYNPNRPGGPGPLTSPVIDYPHTTDGTGGFSVTGGYVYRGPDAGLRGVYLYADFITNQVWSFRVVNGVAVDAENRTSQLVQSGGTINNIASFGEDGQGRMYIIGIGGDIFRLNPQIGAGDGADVLSGGDGNDRILGGVGNDILYGGADNDSLFGGTQSDTLYGGTGRDLLTGGAGADRFVFSTVADSPLGSTTRDMIMDFTNGQDKINLSLIDAQPGQAGNQAFSYIGTAGFTGEGQIKAVQVGGDVVLYLNTAGTSMPEMQIALHNVLLSVLDKGDFIL
jgi:glucose/arabinose dehydrogenase